jgi:alkylation response protein AidB-like acyl-CoA dehydrogenase
MGAPEAVSERPAFYAPAEDVLLRRAALRRLLTDRHGPAAVHPRIVGDEPADPALWRELAAEMGVCAVLVPAELDGLDLGYADFAMIAGELGAVLYGGPFWGTAVLALPALLAVREEQGEAADLVRAAAAGELTLALAFRGATATLPREVDGRLSGRAALVVDADAADVLCVVAASGDGLGLFAVDRADAGVVPVESIDPTRRLADVTFDGAPARRLAGDAGTRHAIAAAVRAGRIAAAAEAVRGAEETLRLAVAYARQRVQFGRPIGVHQAVKHKCADGLIAVETAKATLGYACAAADDGAPDADDAVLAAKVTATDAYVRVAADSIQIHGTFGYTREALPQSYFRRARWLSLQLGSAGPDRFALAASVLAEPAGDELFPARMPAADDPRREPVREWLGEHPAPTGRVLLDGGYLVPHWPPPTGLGASGDHLVVIEQELGRAGVARPPYPLARDFVAPLIAGSGSPAQQDRYLGPMLSGEEIWCELFSEPEAGSDLASLTTSATRSGDGYLVNGVKIWTSQAHLATWGLLLARTDPDAPKHRGISCFVVSMSAPGVTLRPIASMENEPKWCMVFLDDVRLTDEDRIGAENAGWRIALDVLANERLSMSATPGLLWGEGPTFADLLGVARGLDLPDDLRQRLATGYAEALALHVMRTEALGGLGYASSRDPETVPEVRRALADAHGQAMLELWRDLYGDAGVALDPAGPDDWSRHYFAARSLTLGGGTSEIQRNILAERVLGLPRA